MAKSKNIFLENLEYYLLIPLIFIVRLLSLKTAFKIVSFGARMAFIVDRRHRNRAIQHILHSGIVNSEKSAQKLAFASFVHFAKIGVEIIKIDQYINPENISEYIKLTYVNPEAEKALKNAKAIIYAGAHYGNWEISGLGSSVLVRPIVSVMRPFDNKKIGDYIISKRRMFNQEVCDKNSAIKPLLKAISEGKAIGILSDQHAGSSVGVATTFFGHPARTHFSPAMLHIKTGASIFVGIARRLDDNFRYEISFTGPLELKNPTGTREKDMQKLAQMYTTGIENEIRKDPSQWVWCHRRWLNINRYGKATSIDSLSNFI